MHPLIDSILEASRARGFQAAAPWPEEERRDLIASARARKSRGIIPIIAEIKPTVISAEFQAQVETVRTFIPTIINMSYLCEYGYDYALDLGMNFFKTIKQPVYQKWQELMARYGG